MDDESRLVVERLRQTLSNLGISAEIINHWPLSGKNSADASRILGVRNEQILKCLLFCSRVDCIFVAAIVNGNQQVALSKLEAISGITMLRLATPTEVKQFTGHKVGGVPPTALYGKCQVFVDQSILAQPFIIGSAGSEFVGLKLNPQDLIRLGFIPARVGAG